MRGEIDKAALIRNPSVFKRYKTTIFLARFVQHKTFLQRACNLSNDTNLSAIAVIALSFIRPSEYRQEPFTMSVNTRLMKKKSESNTLKERLKSAMQGAHEYWQNTSKSEFYSMTDALKKKLF